MCLFCEFSEITIIYQFVFTTLYSNVKTFFIMVVTFSLMDQLSLNFKIGVLKVWHDSSSIFFKYTFSAFPHNYIKLETLYLLR